MDVRLSHGLVVNIVGVSTDLRTLSLTIGDNDLNRTTNILYSPEIHLLSKTRNKGLGGLNEMIILVLQL